MTASLPMLAFNSLHKTEFLSVQITGPPQGHVIRTVSKEICLNADFRDAVRNASEANWLQGEIDLRIQAARAGARLPPLWNRWQARSVKPVVAVRPSPQESFPYDLHQRPLPSGNRLPTLLPAQVGPFQHQMFEEPRCWVNTSYEVEYGSDNGKISITFSICTIPKVRETRWGDSSGRGGPSGRTSQRQVIAEHGTEFLSHCRAEWCRNGVEPRQLLLLGYGSRRKQRRYSGPVHESISVLNRGAQRRG